MPFAVCNVSLHLVDVDLTNSLPIFIWSVHVDVHDMLRNHLLGGIRKLNKGEAEYEPCLAVHYARL